MHKHVLSESCRASYKRINSAVFNGSKHLEFNALGGNRHVIVQQLLTYNVINKRQTKLNDLKHEMDEVSLIKFLRANLSYQQKLFLPSSEMRISFSVIKPFIENATENDCSMLHWNFLMQYVEELYQRDKGIVSLRPNS